jgi:cytochrome c2
VTFGVDYGQRAWPRSVSQGRHPGFQAPVYAWLPSIGVSSLIALRGDRFVLWKGDLLIASLGAGTLFRTRVDGDRVTFMEPLRLGDRIRDLTEAFDGRVYVLFDSGSVGVLSPLPDTGDAESSTYFTPAMRGELLFSTCAGCHAPDGRGTAPTLAGVVGRDVANEAGYPYSPALRALGGTWTAERLDAFLANPAAFAPGTTMRFNPMLDKNERAAVVAYLGALP